jgi:alkylation response protein AidB-like acyl-CoA dehydrogenase
MNFDFTPEHEMLKESAREFARREMLPLVDEYEEKEEFPVHLMKKAGENGFIGIRYPEEYGGAGLDKIAECIFLEEINKVCAGMAASIMVQMSLATYPIFARGTEEQKKKYLTPALAGKKIGAFALSEPNAGSDISAIQTRAIKDRNDYIINGSKLYITNGNIGDYIIVAAYTDKSLKTKGISLFIVDADTPGITRRKLKKLGNKSADTAEIFFEDCRVPKETLLGSREGGIDVILGNLQSGRIGYGARSVGVAQAAFDATVSYAKERIQFGTSLSKFQTIRFKLAKMAMDIDTARIYTFYAAWLYDQKRPCMKEASIAKLYSSEMVQRVTSEAMQIFAGAGYMMEYPIQRYFRDARLFTITEGTSEIQHIVIAKELDL